MQQQLEQKGKEQKKENVVGKVVGTFFGGDYKEFKSRVKASLESGEFTLGTGAFLRSVFEQTSLSTAEFKECQKAIRMEVSRLKKEEKRAQSRAETETNSEDKTAEKTKDISKSATEIEDRDRIITDKIRERIMRGAIEKEGEDMAYNNDNGLDNPSY